MTLIVLLTLIIVGGQDVSKSSVARADYTITWCENGGGEPPLVNSDYSAIRYGCSTNPSAIFLDGVSHEVSPGEYNGMLSVGKHKVILDAPSGVTISSITATLVSEIQKSGSSTYVEVGDDAGPLYSQEISRQGATTSHVGQTLPGGDTSVWLGDFCTPNQNVACYFASPYEILIIKGLSLTLHDNELPSLFLTGGRLLLPGSQSGTEDVTFSASAHQSGIAEVDAYLGSTLVGRNAYQSTQCSYTQFDPCPQEVSDDLKVDTRWVADGTYPLILEASDASGNTVSVESGDEVTVGNDATPAGASQGAGAQASSSAPGAPNGRYATTKAQIAYLSGQHGKITVRAGQSASVSGRLTNQTGTPIPDATVDLLYQTVGSSEPFAVGGHATTNANGVYIFTVPPSPSRLIRTGYRAFANDNGYDATADLTENVTATTTLKLTPSRLRGRTFTFYGQVHAGSFPPRQQVDIKALVGSTWTHVTFAPVASNGHFEVRYRLKHRYNHVTFIFRAMPVSSPIWPYEPNESNHAYLHLL